MAVVVGSVHPGQVVHHMEPKKGFQNPPEPKTFFTVKHRCSRLRRVCSERITEPWLHPRKETHNLISDLRVSLPPLKFKHDELLGESGQQ